jgi:hypothetical protein
MEECSVPASRQLAVMEKPRRSMTVPPPVCHGVRPDFGLLFVPMVSSDLFANSPVKSVMFLAKARKLEN